MTNVVVGDELCDVSDGEGVSRTCSVCLAVILDDADPALELRHRLVELPPLQHHVLQLDTASTQLRPGSLQTHRDLTPCIQRQRQSDRRPHTSTTTTTTRLSKLVQMTSISRSKYELYLVHIGLGVQSTFFGGGRHICPKIYFSELWKGHVPPCLRLLRICLFIAYDPYGGL